MQDVYKRQALITLDFPALRFPNIPICTRSAEGVEFKLIEISPLKMK